jgi:hypothetical protein
MTLLGQQDFSGDQLDDTLYWYRVEGVCSDPSSDDPRCVNVGQTDIGKQVIPIWQGQKFLRVIAARGLHDLYEKLGSNYLSPPIVTKILSVKRYSRPVYSDKTDLEPSVAIDEDIAGIPEWARYLSAENEGICAMNFEIMVTSQSISLALRRLTIESEEVSEPIIEPITDRIVSCDCSVPTALNMVCNIANNNELADFLFYNELVFPETNILLYSDGIWQNNLHFSSGNEKWSLLFTWGCVEEVAGSNLDTLVWEFGMLVSRKVGSQVFNTRFLTSISGVNLCSTSFAAVLKLDFSTLTVTINDYLVDFVTYLDNIGLFKNAYWLSKSLVVKFFVASSGYTTPVFDIRPMMV